jgi:hypothetical protein
MVIAECSGGWTPSSSLTSVALPSLLCSISQSQGGRPNDGVSWWTAGSGAHIPQFLSILVIFALFPS